MESVFVLKGQLQKIYAQYSKFIDKGVQFLIAVLTFLMINANLGYFSLLANPVISIGLAVICAFLPPVVTALFAAGLIVAHMYAVSLGLMIVAAIVFLLMFIFYVRFTPKMALIIVLTGLAFMLKVPYIAPVACGLLASPISAVPVAFGAVTYFMVAYVKAAAPEILGADSSAMMTVISGAAKGIFMNKEMWVAVIALVMCTLVVFAVRRMAIAHAWKAAIAAGVAVCIVFTIAGNLALGVSIPFVTLIVGNVAAVVVGFGLELAFFCVDYSRSETLQYEDDEYYYYVKAIPKINLAAPEQTVKTITEDKTDEIEDVIVDEILDETQVIDVEETRKKARKPLKKRKEDQPKKPVKSERAEKSERPAKKVREGDRSAQRKRAPKAKSSKLPGNTEHLLLTQSLEKELKLNKKIK